MKTLLLVIVAILSGCGSTVNAPDFANEPSYAGIKDGQLVYTGSLSEASNKALFEAYEQASNKPTRLLISSTGGEIRLGLELGRWIVQHELDVEVLDLCASSCANYVFPAGKTKYLRKDSVLIWHGSAWQENWKVAEDTQKVFDQWLDVIRASETEFFAELEVDNMLAVYGQRNRPTLLRLVVHNLRHGSGPKQGVDYSLADMKRFGLHNIVLVDGEWDWRKYRPGVRGDVVRIPVSNDYEFTLRRFEI
ncbi:hypothetical protein FM042_06845 [Aliidiomarina halalkaliphila]|uniref:Alpha/beta hydrolase n=1 Tax=Aliidiomarina halalkaliphila TaxID=2593535 RepID=A0A552X0W7_9GAMM|nr:hypothetical protein [Aliidiomarina halalkaliphila]TRW48698.1 hypothetical protein FM042_06845 [Aliidiomarina halalkaliphila]